VIDRHRLRPTLALLALLVSGCAPPVHVPLKAEDAGKIRSTRVRAVVAQEEINAAIEQSNLAAAGGGGLLLALIDAGVDSHRTSKAKSLVEPIRKEAGGYDFRARFGEALQAAAPGLPSLTITRTVTVALRARFTTLGGGVTERSYRGAHTQVNWASGSAEFTTLFHEALATAVAELARDAAQLCP
jgi:hypothetical protein